jgi:hypothetical protein
VAAGAVLLLVGGSAGAASAAAGPAVLDLQPTSHEFGPVPLGAHEDLTLTLTNTGGRASSGLTVTAAGSPAYAVTADGCSGHTLGPGRSCTVTVRFAPTSPGASDATLTATGKHRVAPVSATLTGRGGGFGTPETLPPEGVCLNLDGGVFGGPSGNRVLWTCQYNVPPEPQQPPDLVAACSGEFILEGVQEGTAYTYCSIL